MSFLTRITAWIRRNKWKSVIAAIVLALIVFLVHAVTKPKALQYVTAPAVQGDLTQTVEAVGTVISEKNLALQFRSSGIVSTIDVNEGDRVHAGQRLASVRAGSLAASVASAAAHVQEMQANYDAMVAGSRPEDIAVAQASLDNKKASLDAAHATLQTAQDSVAKSQAKLDALQAQAATSVSGQVAAAGSTISQKVTTAEQAISAINDVFANNDVQDAILRDSPGNYDDLRHAITAAQNALSAAGAAASPTDADSAIKAYAVARSAVSMASDTLDKAYTLLSNLTTNSNFTVSNQTTYKSTIATQRSAVETVLRDIDAAVNDLKNNPADLQTQIAAEESSLQAAQGAAQKASADILTYETSVRIDEAQLQLKKAGSRPEDIDAANARLKQAKADLARASADFQDTLITAPIDGTITKINLKEGEFAPTGTAIEMIGDTPYRIEMFVSEVDIPKVQLAQSGSIELDAFRGTHFALRVGEIDASATDKDGVNKYRVKLDFLHPHDELKIGMTGDAAIVTGSRHNVVSVPLRSVIDDASGKKIVRVQKHDGTIEERPVQTGMEDAGGNVEVTGVQQGETVVVLVK